MAALFNNNNNDNNNNNNNNNNNKSGALVPVLHSIIFSKRGATLKRRGEVRRVLISHSSDIEKVGDTFSHIGGGRGGGG